MALQKQPVDLRFGQGLDTKTDPKQVQPGKMLSLQNTIFQNGGLLQKRNGFAQLTSLPSTADVASLETFDGSLVAVGTSLYNYAPENQTWYNKGPIVPCTTNVLPLVRSATNQAKQDVAVAPNGFSVATWIDNSLQAWYQINDTNSGQIIVIPTQLPATATQPRVFVLGNYFIITFLATVSAATHLQFISIPVATPTSPSAATDFSGALQITSLTAGYDGVVTTNNQLYLAITDVAPKIRILSMNATLQQSTPADIATRQATYMSVTADTTDPLNPGVSTIWITFFDAVQNKIYTAAYSAEGSPSAAVQILAPTVLVSSSSINGVASAAQGGVLTCIYQTSNTYPSGTRSDYVSTITCTSAGSVGSPSVMLRSVGLASKAFILNSTIYVTVVYGGAFQPTYFLSDSNGNLAAKLAYSNAGGYTQTEVLPSVTLSGTSVTIGYLYKDLLTSVNKAQGVANVAGIYSQTGINLVTWNLNNSVMPTAEIGGNLHLGGGFLWMYDGTRPVEHGFHVWPEDITVTPTNSAVTPTGFTHNGSTVLTGVSSIAGVGIGSLITGTNIPAGATVVATTATTITISAPATATGGAITFTITGQLTDASSTVYYYQATYEWTDAAGNIHRSAPSIPLLGTVGSTGAVNTLVIPTLRLTYKQGYSQVRIVIYRWSSTQENYYQITSISNPILNDPTVDTITYTDGAIDSAILGNQLIYTTGGIIENIAAPPVAALTLFNARLIILDAEDPNLVWYSKQVIENVPVETSDLFTSYVAPSIGVQGSTGPAYAVSAMDDKLLIYKRDAMYYINGTGPDNTGANSQFSEPIFITSTAGSQLPESIVFMPNGTMFQSDKGIWILGRDLSTSYIGAPVEQYNSSQVLSAISVPGTNQIRFTLDSNITLMYDYYYGQWGTFTNVPAISSTLYNSLHTYLNASGQIFQESPGTYLDGSAPVLMSFTSGWYSLAGLQGYERAYFLYLLGQYITPHKLAVSIAYNYDPSTTQVSLISPDNYSPVFGSQSGPFGSGTPYGGGTLIEAWRIFLQQQKCQAFQISIAESYDASLGVPAGAGLTLSGMNLVIGTKKGYRTQSAGHSVG